MDIITKPGDKVNIYNDIPLKITEIMRLEGDKWMQQKLKSKQIALKLIKIKQYARGYRMQQCAELIRMDVCADCGHRHISQAYLCRDRFCPVCQWRLSMRRFADMLKIVQGLRKEYPESEWQFVTLTVKNCRPEDLCDTINEMAAAWNRIWARRTTKKIRIIGWARSLEITYNPEANTLHPHYHVLLMWDDGYSPSESEQKWLEQTWIDAVKLKTSPLAQKSTLITAYNNQIIPSLIDQEEDDAAEIMSAVLETYKYSIKSDDLAKMPLGIFRTLDIILRGRRMVAFGGVVKKFAADLGVDNLDNKSAEDPNDDDMSYCVECKSVKLIQVVGMWTGDGYLWRREV